MSKETNDTDRKAIGQMLKDYGVNSEDELSKKLTGEGWDTVKCILCGRNISILSCRYLGGDPVCKSHSH